MQDRSMLSTCLPSLTALLLLTASFSFACAPVAEDAGETTVSPREEVPDAATPVVAEYRLDHTQTHNKFSRAIPPVLRVPSGAIIEGGDGRSDRPATRVGSPTEAMAEVDFDLIHPLTGPVYVEGAEPGDVLAVTLHEVEIGDWGWVGVSPGFGWLPEDFPDPYLATFDFSDGAGVARLGDGIEIPLAPFPGVMGVAPDTDEMLSTIPPRANGGNMDNKYLRPGTTVYFPVLVDGALFSIGDTHAVQGDGEVCGTAIEAPMRIVYEVEVLKGGRQLPEPQYETDEYYAVTGFATTIDEAAKKATRYMIDYLEAERGMDRTEAYVLCSLAGDLKISEVVDVPHVLVSMHMPKSIFKRSTN